MADLGKTKGDRELVTGTFVTDGTSFVFRLDGTPISGVGDGPQAAFDQLLRAEAAAGDLAGRLRELSREQEGERVRLAVLRWSMLALIVFGAVGGALVAAAAMAPRVAVDVAEKGAKRLVASFENMPPSAEESLSRLLQRLDALLGDQRACSPPQHSQE